MVSLRSLITIASVAGLVHCQTTASSVDPQDIDGGIRDQWCVSQRAACPLLCLQLPGASDTPTSNGCDSDTLVYSCVCDNGASPNASEYSQTIPYFLCTEQNNQCVNNCPQTDAGCQTDCRTDNPCGAQNPERVNATSSAGTTATSTTTSTTSSLAPFTGLPDEDNAAQSLSDLTQIYGLFAVFGAFFAGFTILL
ncbi:hypothetical protein BDW59DRAFT_125631 [Aspergillus cavernicola]|uniref:DUF7707 domain-containing protein n=1 Tax=Aspergillus cavernicola TaxID=176166 RepID=A0ABR4IVN1_9EURO